MSVQEINTTVIEMKVEDFIPQIEGLNIKNADYTDIPTELLSPSTSPIAINNHRRVNPVYIILMQKLFAKEYIQNKDLYDEEDLLRVMNSEWQVKRFLLAAKDPKKAFKELLTT